MKHFFTVNQIARNLAGISFCLLMVLTPFFSFGQDLEVRQQNVTVSDNNTLGLAMRQFRNDPRAAKISSGLLAAMEMYGNGKDFSNDSTLVVEGNKILIQAYAPSTDGGQQLMNDLTAMGMTNGVYFKHIVNGMLPFDKIESTMGLTSMMCISASFKPKTRIGAVTSQGDVSMGTDELRNAYGLSGSGLKIGILSDAYNSLGGEAAGIASGDLPGPGNPNGFTNPVENLADLAPFGGIDEGRAMAEIIHDVAPGANLAFHTAFGGHADFALGVLELREAGCDIIVDDVFYFAQPYFQDDLVGQAANTVVQDGAMYFSSAGNSGNDSYDNDFNPAPFIFDFGGFDLYQAHDFGNDDYFQSFTLPPGASINLWLQWDEPSLWAGPLGPKMDLDILIFNEDLTQIVDGSFFCNEGQGVPVEFVNFTNIEAVPTTYNLFIGRWAFVEGNPSRIKYIEFNSFEEGFEYADQIIKSTVVGHPNTKGAIAVGASAYFNNPAFGVSPAFINGFSSVGGTPILFDEIGNRLAAPELRYKPDVTGPDGTNNTFFGGDFEPDGFPNFFGTSASAPHVAALAALLWESNPSASNLTVENILKETALDMDDPRGVHSNIGGSTFDFATGYGFVNGPAALELANRVKNTPTVPTMSEWGLFFFGFIVVLLGMVSMFNLQWRLQPANYKGSMSLTNGFTISNNFFVPFEKAAFVNIFKTVVMLLPVALAIIFLVWGTITVADIFCLPIAALFISYFVYLIKVFK